MGLGDSSGLFSFEIWEVSENRTIAARQSSDHPTAPETAA